FTAGGVDPACARVLRYVPPQEPHRRALRKVGQRITDHSTTHTGVVADALPHQHLPPVEEMGIAGSIEQTARSSVRNGVRLQRRSSTLGQRLALEQDSFVL